MSDRHHRRARRLHTRLTELRQRELQGYVQIPLPVVRTGCFVARVDSGAQ